MKNLEQIKNEYAVSKGFTDWENLITHTEHSLNVFLQYLDELIIIAEKECLKLADKQLLRERGGWDDRTFGIVNENNIIK